MPALECLFTHTSMRVLIRHSRHILIRPCAYYSDTVDIEGMLIGKDQHAQASGTGRGGRRTRQEQCMGINGKREGGETDRDVRECHGVGVCLLLQDLLQVWADLLFFERTWFYTTSYAALSPRHYNRQEVLRCSCGVAQKDSCTVCGRTAFTPCHRPHSQPSICAGGEKGTLVHGRTVSACCTHCMSPRRRSKASTVASSVGSLYSLFVVLPSLHRSLFRGPGVRWRGWRSRSLGCLRSVTVARPRLVEQPSRDSTTCTRSASSLA
jgi:hypothetical protein